MSDELKSCPFCGGKATLEEDSNFLGRVRWTVGCNDRNEDGEVLCYGYQSLTTFPTQREASVAWNRRASDTRQSVEIAMTRVIEESHMVAAWINNALDDPDTCQEMKADITRWIEALAALDTPAPETK